MKTIFFLIMFVSVVHGRDYPATVISVHDADTIVCSIDLGLDVFKNEKVRLAGIDAPELKTKEGKEAAAFLKTLLVGKKIVLSSPNDVREKYGRLLTQVILDGININQLLIKKGMAKPYDGGPR